MAFLLPTLLLGHNSKLSSTRWIPMFSTWWPARSLPGVGDPCKRSFRNCTILSVLPCAWSRCLARLYVDQLKLEESEIKPSWLIHCPCLRPTYALKTCTEYHRYRIEHGSKTTEKSCLIAVFVPIVNCHGCFRAPDVCVQIMAEEIAKIEDNFELD